MPVIRPRLWSVLTLASLVWLLALFFAGGLCAQESANSASLDLYLFNQDDRGGNPYQNESLRYYGMRAAARLKVGDKVTLKPTITISHLEVGGNAKTPSTITNATTTSASSQASRTSRTQYTPATVEMGFDFDLGDGWKLMPGVFFSYQTNYISRGLDLAVSKELFDGNTITTFGYSLRWDAVKDASRNLGLTGAGGEQGEGGEGGEEGLSLGFGGGWHTRMSHTLSVGLTQIVSSAWRLSGNLQYSLQTGLLGSPTALVTVFDGRTPVLFVNEELPNTRRRIQLSERARFAPARGWGLGLDASEYFDSWNVQEYALEPSAEGPFWPDVARWRVWYRFADQFGTPYFRRRPQKAYHYQTDDSDLGTFTMQSGGLEFIFDIARTGPAHWRFKTTGYGIYRSDGISGYGFLFGLELDW